MFQVSDAVPQTFRRVDSQIARERRFLLIVASIAVVLLGPAFMGGFVTGRLTAPRNGLETASAPDPQIQPVAASAAAPQKAAAPAHKDAVKNRPAAARPASRQIYLQLSVTVESRAEGLVGRLQKDGFSAVASEVPSKPRLRRVLIGPFPADDESSMRAELENKGFPGQAALRRRF